jgi:hypothetical protein
MAAMGSRIWAIPEGYIPSTGRAALASHEAACILNAGDVGLTLYFSDPRCLPTRH